jgi:Flp pilus assembly protein TadG
MATKELFYTQADATITRDHCAGEVGGAATTAYGKFHSFAATRLKAVHVRVTTAGTATTHKLDVFIGTASVATVALSTSIAGVTATIPVDLPVPSMGAVEVKTGADAAGKAVVTYEYSYAPAATITK